MTKVLMPSIKTPISIKISHLERVLVGLMVQLVRVLLVARVVKLAKNLPVMLQKQN